MGTIWGGLEENAINSLYEEIGRNPKYLEDSDLPQFVQTPLHEAASRGWMLVALEIQRLTPSFGKKLNPDGLTPVNLALQRVRGLDMNDPVNMALQKAAIWRTVGAMIKVTPELASVQGREGITPLHYAAQMNYADLLAEFLLTCPGSIDVVTVRGESAVHVAVTNGSFEAFEVLCGWLDKYGRTAVLGCRDRYGNTVLHVAASIIQERPKILRIRRTLVNEMNYSWSTPRDIVEKNPDYVDLNHIEAIRILEKFGGASGRTIRSGLHVVKYLSSKFYWVNAVKRGMHLEIGLGMEMRNALLVVAILLVTATYQAVLSPPGGNNYGYTNTTNSTTTTVDLNNNNNNSTNNNYKLLEELSLSKNQNLSFFVLLNSAAFAVSLGFIVLFMPLIVDTLLLIPPILFLMVSYLWAIRITWVQDSTSQITFITVCACIYFGVAILLRLIPLLCMCAARRGVFEGTNSIYTGSKLARILYIK